MLPQQTARRREPGPTAIYARVSTERQAVGDKTSLDRQERTCRRAADRLGFTVRDEYVIKEAHSASDPDDRPGLEALYAAAARHEFQYVLMDVVDRTTRAGPWDLPHICRRFLDLGVEPVWAGHPDLDVTTAEGQVEAAKLAIRAWEDKQTIARRFAEGKAERIEGGLLIRSPAAYGYQWNAPAPRFRGEYDGDDTDPRTAWEENPDTAPTVVRIFEYLADGWRHHSDASAVKVMDMMNAEGEPTPSAVKHLRRRDAKWRGRPARWQVATVLYIVRNPAYKGQRVQLRTRRDEQNRHVTRDPGEWRVVDVPALVTPDVWEDANKQLARNHTGAHKHPRQFTVADVLLYGGHVRCAYCRRTMSPRLLKGKMWQYSCVVGGRPADERAAQHPHGMPTMLARTVDEEVWRAAVWLLSDPDYLRERLRRTDEVWPPEAQMQHYAGLVGECDAKEAGLAAEIANLGGDPLLAGVRGRLIDDVKQNAQARAEYAAKLAAAQREYNQRTERDARLTAFTVRAAALSEGDRLEDLSPAERRELLLDLGAQVRVKARKDPRDRLSVLFTLSEEAAAHVPEDVLEAIWSHQTAAGDSVTVLALPAIPPSPTRRPG
jgi:DNA invertase Pin-like site-specific DNA recombinase